MSSFVLGVPLRHLRPSVIYSVPCDWILQMAYCIFWRRGGFAVSALSPHPRFEPEPWLGTLTSGVLTFILIQLTRAS